MDTKGLSEFRPEPPRATMIFRAAQQATTLEALIPPADALRVARATIWVAGGIIICRDDPEAVVTADLARERLAVHDQLSGGTRMPLLVEAGARARVEAEAGRLLLGPEATRRAQAVAIVVPSTTARLVLNAYVGLKRPPIPFRLFNDVERAYHWLQDNLRD